MTTAPCLNCRKRIDLDSAPEAPFCSKRCQQVDLGRWISEKYGFPVEPGEGDGFPVEPGEGEGEAPHEDSPNGGNGNA